MFFKVRYEAMGLYGLYNFISLKLKYMPRQKSIKKEETKEESVPEVVELEKNSEPKKVSGKKSGSKIGLALLLIIALAAAAYGGYHYSKLKDAKNDSEAAKAKETEELLGKIGVLIELPEGEAPSVATVSDKEKLKEQSFFKKSENGDKVLIYVQAEKAILYRPSVNKIIEVAPVYMNKSKEAANNVEDAKNVEDVQAVQGVQGAENVQAESVKVALYNGTTITGLTKIAELSLNEKMPKAEVVAKENAQKNDYSETIVVDNSGKNDKEAKEIADILGGKVAPMPEGESSDADIVVILAK